MRVQAAACWIAVWCISCLTPAVGQEASPADATGSEALAADDPIGQERAKKEILAAAASYVQAFNQRDAETLQAFWTKDGVYTSRATGERVLGRESIADEFAEIFADDDGPKLALTTDSVELISPGVALERGRAVVTQGEDVKESRYDVVYVQRDGKWLIDRVTEEPIVPPAPSHYEQLQGLEWMIGDWSDQGEDFQLEVSCDWTRQRNFISRTFKLKRDDGSVSSGLQLIGWDARREEIRSWLFDSDGGVVTGAWELRDDRWFVVSVATLADGSSGSFTSLFRPLEDGSYAWQKINRVHDGRLLPNIDEVIVRRR
ncbi:MAG: YybH family protein [Rubripirellula sp.]